MEYEVSICHRIYVSVECAWILEYTVLAAVFLISLSEIILINTFFKCVGELHLDNALMCDVLSRESSPLASIISIYIYIIHNN